MSVTNGVITVLPPPEGYIVNFDHPQRNGDVAAYAVAGVGSVFALLFLCQRLYTKAFVRKSLGIDDACLLVAWVFTTTIQVNICKAFAGGYLGVHAWEIPVTKFESFVRSQLYLNPIIYAPPTALAKLVLLLFYLQLQNSQKLFQWSVYFTICVNVGSNLGILFSSIFACNPIARGWDITITTGTCIDRPALFEATAAFGVIVDVLVIAIPIPMVIGLQMSRAKKAGLIFMFAIGSATLITSIVRLALLIRNLNVIDETWGTGPVCVWICVEANLYIMCASLPTVRLFVKSFAPRLMGSTGNSKDKSGKGSALPGLSTRGLQSIGSSNVVSGTKPKRQHYGRFDEEQGYVMQTFVVGGEGEQSNRDDRSKSDDGDSQKGIVQTTTMQIKYS